jgi:hypothetical protein
VAKNKECGTILFLCKNGEHRLFSGVYYIMWLTENIVSVGQLDEAGYDIHIKMEAMMIHEPNGWLLARIEQARDRLYVLNVDIAQTVCQAAWGEEKAWHWHDRLGHINMLALRWMVWEDLVWGFPDIEQVDQLCDACLANKQRQSSFPSQA